MDRLGVGGRYVVTYCGAIGLAHGLEVVLRAALSLRERGREDIVFLLVGDGARLDDLRREAARLALSNVVFTGSLDRSEIPGVLALSDACLVHLRRSKIFTTVMPSKIFDGGSYVKAGDSWSARVRRGLRPESGMRVVRGAGKRWGIGGCGVEVECGSRSGCGAGQSGA